MKHATINHTSPRNIAIIRQNRANLRALGLNQSELAMLEEIALMLCRGSTLGKLRGSYLAQGLGISRQWANALLRRLDQLGLILRFKTGLVRLNLEKLNKFSQTAANIARRKMPKSLKRLLKSGRGNTAFPNKEQSTQKGNFSCEMFPKADRSEALQALKSMYVPVHLRKNA